MANAIAFVGSTIGRWTTDGSERPTVPGLPRGKMFWLVPVLLAPLAPALFGDMSQARPRNPAAPLVEPGSITKFVPPPLLLRPISREAAVYLNRTIPFAGGSNFRAKPFRFRGDEATRDRALECLAAAVYYEAAGERREGQQAVAQVVLNRVRHPAFPASICAVVFQGATRETGCQFTFTCDGSLMRAPSRAAWSGARTIANEALSGSVFAPVGMATHYHTEYVVPYWSTTLSKSAKLGTHIFYRWPGPSARPAAFRQKYAGMEADPRDLRAAALMVDQAWSGSALVLDDDVIQFVPDKKSELAAVIALLATVPAPHETHFQTVTRNWFARYAEHPAVQIYRDLGSVGVDDLGSASGATSLMSVASATRGDEPPVKHVPDAWRNPAVLLASTVDFARQSDLDRFLAEQRRSRRQAIAEATRAISIAAAAWRAYAGIPVRRTKAILTTAPMTQASACLAKQLGANDMRIVAWTTGSRPQKLDETFIKTGLAQNALFEDWSSAALPMLQEQVVRAVFTRIVALSQGPRAGQLAAQHQADRGYTSVPEFAARLQQYERRRDQYGSLRDFLRVLLPTGAHVGRDKRVSPLRQCEQV